MPAGCAQRTLHFWAGVGCALRTGVGRGGTFWAEPVLLQGVSIALGQVELLRCVEIDASTDGQVTVDELVAAVHSALSGCGDS